MTASVRDYKELLVWQKAMALVRLIYEQTRSFPDSEKFGLTSQMRRAAVSVPSNIAEGQGRLSSGEFRQFLGTAKGSLFELETQTLIARDLQFLPEDEMDTTLAQIAEVGRMLSGLIRSIAPKTK